MTLIAAQDALRQDADRWTQVSHDLQDAAADAAAVSLEISALPGEKLEPLYTQVQDRIVSLLKAGGGAALDVGYTLTAVRIDLNNTDAAAQEELRKLWRERDL